MIYLVSLTVVACGGLYLDFRTTSVLVAAAAAGPGTPIVSVSKQMRASALPRGITRSSEQPRLATSPIDKGAVLTSSNSSFSPRVLTIAVDIRMQEPEPVVADVLIAPCGRLLRRALRAA